MAGEEAFADDGGPLRGVELLDRIKRGDVVVGEDRVPRLKQASPATPSNAATGGAPPETYAAAALADECGAVAAAPEGTRNDQLNRSAFNLGQLVGAGALDESQARASLADAAKASGLDARETNRTIESGLTAGMADPRRIGVRREGVQTVHTLTSDDDRAEEHLDEAARFARDLAYETHRMRVREAARRMVAQERDGVATRPPVVPLSDFLAVDDPDVAYRVGWMLPVGARAILAAQYKSGKSTLIGNLIRSLVDGVPFLGEFHIDRTCSVTLIDDELDERMLRRWLRDQGIVNTDRVRLVPLRGKVSTFDLLDPQIRAEWARLLAGSDVLLLDCLRPCLDALGLDEAREAGRFLVAFDGLLDAAGIDEAVVVHHMGHNGERSRGDSRILDWPDVTWKLVRDDADDLASSRYLSAFGRDVDVAERELAFDPSTRHLTVSGGSRKDTKIDAALDDVLDVLANTGDPLSLRALQDAVMKATEHKRANVRAAIKKAVGDGRIETMPGPHNATLHVASVPVCRVRHQCASTGACVCASAPYRWRTHSTHTETPQKQFADGTLTYPDHGENP